MSRLAILFVLLLVIPAQANVGRSEFPGTRSTEPNGLREIAIEGEELRFDLRPLGDRGTAKVSATYHLDNRGAATITEPLVFVSGSYAAGTEVTFDGATVRGTTLDDAHRAALPPSWNAPLTTPALDGDGTLGYATEHDSATSFTLEIPPGRHLLVVTYAAAPEWNKSSSGGTIVYQLGYVLAPARDWGSFRALDVSVEVPPGWRVATSPALARTGDTLHAQFPSLPADTLGITLQAPTGTLYAILQYALPLLALLVLAGGGFILYVIGRARGRNAEDMRPLWPVSLPASLLWAVAIGVSGGFAAIRSDLAIPENQSALHGYGAAFGILLAVLVALISIPVGVVLARAGRSSRAS